ncbi:hypothetical protein B0T18DRAFT_391396 [Schizothecium vesticola]|uniref:Uncharacterized protein n=1 Tax=Schizothecium vesticola TaxID=314040 RepID=A0AA40EWX9_9PEZI|nr:hypothetical protein B0T18DRAFT_391396 [Schizothecium vesticola]
MPPAAIKREEVDDRQAFRPSAPQPSRSHQEAGRKGQPPAQPTGSSQQHLRRTAREPIPTTEPFGKRRGFITSNAGRRQRDPHSLEAQQHRQLKHLRDVLHHAWEHRFFFQPVFGWVGMTQAQAERPSRSSNRAHHRNVYRDWDYPSEDALGPQYRLRYSESPKRTPKRSLINDEPPKRSRIKEEPLDWKTPDVKPQVNPWAKYAGPSPYSARLETSRMPFAANILRRVVTNGAGWLKEEFKPTKATPPSKPIQQEPRGVSRTTAFISPQIKGELSSDKDETFVKQTKQQPIASSKRPSQSDGVEERPLKQARGFEYQPSQNSTKYQPAASVEEGVEEGSDVLGGHRFGSAFHVTPASCFGSAPGCF